MTGLWNTLLELEWLTPTSLWLVPLIPVALWWGRPRRGLSWASLPGDPRASTAGAATTGAATAGAATAGARPLPRSLRQRSRALPTVLAALGLLLVVLALSRPVARRPLPVEAEGIDILLCLDTSSSMAAQDLDPERSRLDVARSAAARFIAGRPHDRIGLIGFARYPDLRCPPTRDHDALRTFLGRIELVAAESPEDLTGIGTALGRAAQELRPAPDAEAPTSAGRVVILLTDGEETVAHAASETGAPTEIGPRAAARLCQNLGVRVHAIAIGSTDQLTGGSLDTTELRDVAAIANGSFAAAPDARALGEVYREIDRLETLATPEPRFEFEDRFAWFLGSGLLALALAVGLQRWWKVLP